MEKEQFEQRKKTIFDFICDRQYVPMKVKEIAAVLNIPKSQRQDLQEVLNELVSEGKVEVSRSGKYSRGEAALITGLFESNAKGFGFVSPEGEKDDIFIPEEKRNGAFHKDTVQVRLKSSRGKRREGEVVKVIAHGLTEIVGTYEARGHYGFVCPDNPRITTDLFIPEGHSAGARSGDKVAAEITQYLSPAEGQQAGKDGSRALKGKSSGDGASGKGKSEKESSGSRDREKAEPAGRKRKNPEGRIVEILGHVGEPGVDITSVARSFDLPTVFPDDVLQQADRMNHPVSDAEREGRLDLREIQTVTIDGEDAKDFDDAVSLRREDGVYYLGVHIADVTHYVRENGALDREAKNRGTSVYLTDRVIPMLPFALSNGICSLNAGQDRLALSCLMTLDEKGRVTDHQIAETVIRVGRRMTYTDVDRIITDRDPEAMEEYREFVPMFDLMKELSLLIRENRRKRGAVGFDFAETKIILGEDDEPVEIQPYLRNAATDLIEDFMLIANETVAEEYYWRRVPFLYRTHENPDPDRIRELNTQIANFGYHVHVGDEVHPKEMQKLLDRSKGSPEEALIARLSLRSMKRARYTPECTGHFGLAARYYCHFTSPIRRYPDLQIHRIIKETLHGRMDENRSAHYEKILPGVARQCSSTERRADEAERESEKLKKVQYMKKHIREEYDGTVSGVTASGIYVELPNTVEGMVRVDSLEGDRYEYDGDAMILTGRKTGITYRLGQPVRVRVTGADERMRTIDFELVSQKEE